MTRNKPTKVVFESLLSGALERGALRESVALLAIDADSQVGKEIIRAQKLRVPRNMHVMACSVPREYAMEIVQVRMARGLAESADPMSRVTEIAKELEPSDDLLAGFAGEARSAGERAVR